MGIATNRQRTRFLSVLTFLIIHSSFIVVSAIEMSKREAKINRHLIITSAKNPLAGVPDFVATQSGIFEAELFQILSEHLNFTYEIHPPNEMAAGIRLANGSWTGAMGQLQRKEVEMCASTTSPSLATREVVDTSYPIYFVDTGLLIPFPSESDKALVLFTPFSPEVWACLGCTSLLAVLISWMLYHITKSSKEQGRSQGTVSYWIFFYIGILTNQGRGEVVLYASSSFRVFAVFSLYSLWLTSNYYTGTYTSLLAVPIYKPVVNSVEDLAQRTTVKALSIKGSSTDIYVVNSKDPPLRKIAEQLQRHPEQRLTNALYVGDISTIVKKNTAFFITQPDGLSLVQASYDLNNRQCKVTMAEKTFWKRPQSYTYAKNSPLREIIDREILILQQSGLLAYAEKKAMLRATRNPCSIFDGRRNQESIMAFRLRDIAGALYILAAGFSVALLVLLAECITINLRPGRKNSRTSHHSKP